MTRAKKKAEVRKQQQENKKKSRRKLIQQFRQKKKKKEEREKREIRNFQEKYNSIAECWNIFLGFYFFWSCCCCFCCTKQIVISTLSVILLLRSPHLAFTSFAHSILILQFQVSFLLLFRVCMSFFYFDKITSLPALPRLFKLFSVAFYPRCCCCRS